MFLTVSRSSAKYYTNTFQSGEGGNFFDTMQQHTQGSVLQSWRGGKGKPVLWLWEAAINWRKAFWELYMPFKVNNNAFYSEHCNVPVEKIMQVKQYHFTIWYINLRIRLVTFCIFLMVNKSLIQSQTNNELILLISIVWSKAWYNVFLTASIIHPWPISISG